MRGLWIGKTMFKPVKQIKRSFAQVLWLCCSSFILTSAVPAHANAQPTIDAIEFEGLRRVDKSAVEGILKSKVGDSLAEGIVTDDLKALWNTGFFKDVAILQEERNGELILIVALSEKPSLRNVTYEGNDALSKDDIDEVVNVRPYTILNEELLQRNVTKIRDLYVEKGHYLADISYSISPVGQEEQSVDVTFKINENPKVVVKQISFLGNKSIKDSDIKSVIQTREGNELSFITSSGTYKEEFFATDLMRIQAYYHDHGFVTIKVGEPTATISPDRRFIYLSVPIEEGERYNIGEISFSGDVELKGENGELLVSEETLRKRIRVNKGELFNRTKLVADIQSLTDAYRNQGYAYANIIPNSRPNPETKTVDLEFGVQRGDLVYIGRIEVVGNTKTRDKVIRREMRVYEGELYKEIGIKASEARITQLGYFEKVEIRRETGTESNEMNLTIVVKEKSTGTFQLGAGFSSIQPFWRNHAFVGAIAIK